MVKYITPWEVVNGMWVARRRLTPPVVPASTTDTTHGIPMLYELIHSGNVRI